MLRGRLCSATPRHAANMAAASYYLPLTSRTHKLSLLLVTYDLEKADAGFAMRILIPPNRPRILVIGYVFKSH